MQSSSSGISANTFRPLNHTNNRNTIINENDVELRNHEMLLKRSATEAALDAAAEHMMGLSSDDDSCDKAEPPPKKTPPPNGKKTKGRVKIKMEFIDNKLRRYTTFSKRKTGIMKKAYELSTLTGTQVMLLVASETGHVYTFATRKLQPMITSEAGKALIQTCLNSPDPLTNCGSSDQRMSATGFEETEFTYSIGDEDQKVEMGKAQGLYPHMDAVNTPTLADLSGATAALPVAAAALLNAHGATTKPNNNISMQMPASSGFATILTPGLTNAGQQSTTGDTCAQNMLTAVPSTQHGLSMVSGNMVNLTPVATSNASSMPGTVMYQTAQGVVYATPTSAGLSEGVIFNFGQLPQEAGGGTSTQQFITIPVSLTPTSQIVQGVNSSSALATVSVANTNNINSVTDLSKSSGSSGNNSNKK